MEEEKKLLCKESEEVWEENKVLKDENEKISGEKKEIVEMWGKVEEVRVDKVGFFRNIRDEFGSGVSVIVGGIEGGLKLRYNGEVIEELDLVEGNWKYVV